MTERPTCALCRERVLVKHSAWISHLHGFQVHFDCLERAGTGWYKCLLEERTP